MSTSAVINFVHEIRYEDLPEEVTHQAKRCLLDLVGVAAAGSQTKLAAIARDHAVTQYAAGDTGARLLFDGRHVSTVGAALAGAATIDSFDAHDGHVLTKGHIGAAVLPALLAYVDSAATGTSGREFLTALVVGYEIGTRAGIALHRTSAEYHTSGAWNALACAAIGARLLRLGTEETLHALGIAEYHGPRSPMMREIDHPTMVKDGSMWGAAAGVSAAFLAKAGFTGAPAETVTGARLEDIWSTIGTRWTILEQYLKPQAICRWAQPAVQAVLDLIDLNGVECDDVEHIEVDTFEAATRLATRSPETTEQAQYSLPYPVATAMVHGRITSQQLIFPMDRTPSVTRLSESMVVREDENLTKRFPAERLASVSLHLYNGKKVTSKLTEARGGPGAPLTDDEVRSKFKSLSQSRMDDNTSSRTIQIVDQLGIDSNVDELLDIIMASPTLLPVPQEA